MALTTFDADDYVLQAMRLGATGFIVKSTRPAELADLVRAAAGGNSVLSPTAARSLVSASVQGWDRTVAARQRLACLTERERDILVCLGQGMSNAGIAGHLHLSEATVKSYVSRMLPKLGCDNRTQAGLLAYEAGYRPASPVGVWGASPRWAATSAE